TLVGDAVGSLRRDECDASVTGWPLMSRSKARRSLRSGLFNGTAEMGGRDWTGACRAGVFLPWGLAGRAPRVRLGCPSRPGVQPGPWAFAVRRGVRPGRAPRPSRHAGGAGLPGRAPDGAGRPALVRSRGPTLARSRAGGLGRRRLPAGGRAVGTVVRPPARRLDGGCE